MRHFLISALLEFDLFIVGKGRGSQTARSLIIISRVTVFSSEAYTIKISYIKGKAVFLQ